MKELSSGCTCSIKTGIKNSIAVVHTLKVLKFARFDSFAFTMMCKDDLEPGLIETTLLKTGC